MNSYGSTSSTAIIQESKAKLTKADAEEAIKILIEYLGDDPHREGLIDTPRRVIKSFKEFYAGYDLNGEEILSKTFEDVEKKINEEISLDNTEKSAIKEINIDFKDKYIRLYSEFENYRKRTAKEKIDIITNSSEKVLKEILPVLDDFERAISNNKNVNEASAIKEGIELIHNKFYKILTNQGLTPMKSIEKDFDPDIHEAITKIPAPKDKMKGKVIDVIEKGYTLNEKVIRFAKVVVGE
jgi:molecular chaperone GrpE